MIYMVELDWRFDDPARERRWEEWYEDHLVRLLSVPGFTSAQRFQSVTQSASPYLAVYSVESMAVFDSEPYRAMGGPNSSREFHGALSNWCRNIYDGISRAPAVAMDHYLLTVDGDLPHSEASGMAARITWLTAVGYDANPQRRGVAVIDQRDAAEFARMGARVLKPLTGYLTPDQGAAA